MTSAVSKNDLFIISPNTETTLHPNNNKKHLNRDFLEINKQLDKVISIINKIA